MTTDNLVEVTTAHVEAPQQFAFYREGVLRRLLPTAIAGPRQAFRASMRRIIGSAPGIEIVEHASDAVIAGRTAERIRRDDCDDISIDLMHNCKAGTGIVQNGERKLKSGDFCFIDYGRPLVCHRMEHSALGVIASRARVREVIGDDASALAGQPIPMRGLARVLRQHLIITFNEADHMSADERRVAADSATDMMLALLQTLLGAAADVERFAAGYRQAALTLIERRCGDPDLTPDRVAALLGCARASLYREFRRRGESVGRAIWAARLERARHLLISPEGVGLTVGDVAWRCGFQELATFSRMFRRRFGLSPSDARALATTG